MGEVWGYCQSLVLERIEEGRADGMLQTLITKNPEFHHIYLSFPLIGSISFTIISFGANLT